MKSKTNFLLYSILKFPSHAGGASCGGSVNQLEKY